MSAPCPSSRSARRTLALAALGWACVQCGGKSGPAADATTSADGKPALGADTVTATAATRTEVVGDLTLNPAALSVDLAHNGAARTRLRLDRLRIGQTTAFDKDFNYNPSNLAHGDFPALRWLHVQSARWVAPSTEPAGTGGAPENVALRLLLATSDAAGKAGPNLALDVESPSGALTLHAADGALATAWENDAAPDPIVVLGLTFEVGATERFYGLGETFDTPQHRGRVRAMQIEADLDIESSYNEAHVPVPLLIGTRGWGVFVASRRPGSWDVAAARADEVVAQFQAPSLRFHLLAAGRAVDVPSRYTQLTGAPALPAPWALGGLLWRNENESQAEFLADVQAIRDHDLALSGMWIDRPYDLWVNAFGFDSKKFPDPQAMIAAARAAGLHVGAWSTPYVEKGAPNHDKVNDNGWFAKVPAPNSKLYKWGPPLDLTNPAVVAFWKAEIGKMVALGIDGWKLDYGEDIQVGLLTARVHSAFWDGSDERTMHHGYALAYHKPYAQTLPKGGGWLLVRGGTWGDQALSSLVWPGDLCANWARHRECDAKGTCHAGGLPAAVSATLSLATSGYPLFGSDTGGYRHGRAHKELFLRWLQHTALTPVLQIGGGSQHNPWDFAKYGESQFDSDTLAIARTFIRLHARLFPYLWTHAVLANAHQDIGPVRPLGLLFPELEAHPALASVEADEYLLGDDLLVAPVTAPGGKRTVLFPKGKWTDWFTREVYGLADAATAVDVAVPLDRMPLYVHQGALVPLLRPTIDTLATAVQANIDAFGNVAGWLHVVVVRGGTRLFDLWDGTSLGLTDFAGGTSLEFSAGSAFHEGVVYEVWSSVAPKAVTTGLKHGEAGTAVPEVANPASFAACTSCWRFDGASQTVFVRQAFPATQPAFGFARLTWP